MSDDIELYLLLFILCLLLSAFFSSSETAFVALQRIRVKHMVENNVKGARRVARMIERPEKLLSTILLGNNFVNVAAATVGTLMAVDYLGPQWGALAAILGVTALVLVFGEVVPKTIAANHAERLAVMYARPIMFLSWVLTPFIPPLAWIG
ncbi:MAG: DUF21 domain-containing protein, partial [Dehalococcoidales bacterium]|nr:DUF21 domain-containing protein [Dehalococcoidales bacterium]